MGIARKIKRKRPKKAVPLRRPLLFCSSNVSDSVAMAYGHLAMG